MSTRSIGLTEELQDYLVSATLNEPELFTRLRAETAELPLAEMQIAPEQGQFMKLLVELIGARRALEIGTFTGYSALCVASALPDDGLLIACDVSEEWTSIARRYWQEANLTRKIDLCLGPGAETLDRLIEAGEGGSFDFAFIDADKLGYDRYYEQCLQLLRLGGLIAIDNALRDGRVADELDDHENTVAMRALNTKVAADARVTSSLVPIGDGLLLARKT